MVTISFLLKPIVSSLLKQLSLKWWERIKINQKIKKISDFSREYDNTFVDSYRFQQVLNSEQVKNSIFTFVFSSKLAPIPKRDFINQLTKLALDEINIYRQKQGISLIHKHDDVKNYFKDLIGYLEGIRDEEFSYKESSIISNLQNSIVENNNDLKLAIKQYLTDFNENKKLESISEKKIHENLERNIKNLNERYKPLANVDLEINNYFHAATYEEKFIGTLKDKLVELNTLLVKTMKEDRQLKKIFHELTLSMDYFKEILVNNNKMYLKKNEIDQFLTAIENTKNSYQNYLTELKVEKRSQQSYTLTEYLKSSITMIESLQRFFQSEIGELLQNPYLIIHGEGGIGKSHLLATNAEFLAENGHEVLLFLGQHFNTSEHPFEQIFSELEFLGTRESFLNELNTRAENRQKKTILIIDALNEGNGKNFWKDYLIDFLNLIKNYPSIAVVLSVRSNFIKSILPDDIEKSFPISRIHHPGFANSSLEDLKPLFDFYKIDPLLFPTLNSEAQNPLFLHIYCKVYKEKKFEYNGWNVLQLLNEYTNQINLKISTDKKFEYPAEINLVHKILIKLAEELYREKKNSMEIENFYDIVKNVSKVYVNNYQGIINSLYEENIIVISKQYNQKEIVYFTYERFSDLYIALFLNEQEEYNKGMIKEFLEQKDHHFYAGIIEAISIVLPEQKGIELLDYIDYITVEHVEAFISGLSWRSNNISERTTFWIGKCLNSDDKFLISAIYNEILKQSFLEESPINGEYLFKHLNSLTMSKRDAIWTTYINHSEIPLQLIKLIDIDSLYFEKLNSKNYRLLVSTWGWFLSSTNIYLRDITTKSLTKLFLLEPNLISYIFEMYKNVNDPYILERILASIYGAILKLKKGYDDELANTIFNHFFSRQNVYPNILIRDYIRGILSIFINEDKIKIDKALISPPYQSIWYIEKYSLTEINLVQEKIKSRSRKPYTGFDKIVNSMTTEYGRGVSRYGDFGRYTFGSSLSDWKNLFNDQDLSNIAVMNILRYGYKEKLHGTYDLSIQEHNRHQNSIERIGKKYQWISLFEMLAKVTDNFPITKEVILYSEEYEIQKMELNKKLNKLIKNRSYFKDLDYTNNSVNDEEDTSENSEGKNYLTEAESIIGVQTEVIKHYDGPWMFYLRNIDPSKIDNIKRKEFNFSESYLPEHPNEEWVYDKSEIENIVKFIEYDYESNEYVSLGQMLSQEIKNDKGYEFNDSFFVKSKALLVSKEKMKQYINNKTTEKNNLSVDWPNKIQGFLFEHYDSPFFYEKANFEEIIEIDIATNAIWEYSWERNVDLSLNDEGSNYLLPYYRIVEELKLHQDSEGVWKDNSGSIVAMDTASLGFENNLLIDKEKIFTLLNENSLEITWDFYVEKKSNGILKRYWIMAWCEENKLEYTILDEE